MLKALCQSLCLALPLAASAQPSVVFINPGLSTETFWTSYTRFMQAAADELGMNLRVEYSERRADLALTQARAILSGAQRPDYLVLVNEQYVAPEVLRLSRGTGVKLLLVNNGLTASQVRSIQAQPDKYAEPLGTLMSNDEQAGFQMLHQMVAQLPHDVGAVDLVAFAGVKTTPASQLREEGMRRALADFPQVRLRQVVYGGWSRQRAYEQAQQLLERYPATRLVWSANDEMAFGAMQAFEAAGRKPGRDVLFSAVNSSPEALRARIDGRLSVLMGGHFTLGGWAMVMLHDDALGLKLNRDGLREHSVPVLQPIDRAKAQRWLKLLERADYGVDFQRYSAQGRPTDYQYPFLTSPMDY
ncbi:ABC transporter substrate-binding protein [Pseudomonas monteilii]|jgi:ABC-type sugar transport system substrate-binding protein|uniref:LacI family transcriptional regulator n=2 Tax=Pseudomonas putida group TaxID=136845 RepID=A0AAE6RAB0_9PSED|nr:MULTISPECIES: ABC transporter substrate-binding protein [Pseudomonas]MBB3270404.1 ABC-type sugar transport system substrate-binding protein [Pseudomonas sp. OG7]MBH3394320.1 ABC transporter substrate-binding protein [Pseudomonas monteilii]MBH3456934.1 ABC transporter substrate-binding protein [Pseudomonas monteilii]MCJ7854210.1 ABC transporter substrate-binding protein [Pseudomonas monteilii]MDD2123607.1 ABC transporter substrate-binding protein [Pseudomonas monteilii]